MEPGPPKTVHVIESKAKETTVDVLLGWEPPEGKQNPNHFHFNFLGNSSMNKNNLFSILQKGPVFIRLFWKIGTKMRLQGQCASKG